MLFEHQCFDISRMESLPDAIVQYILSHLLSAKDVACCICVSKRWKESIPFIRSLYFARNIFDNQSSEESPDSIVYRMVSSILRLEELVVYCPFTHAGLASWLSAVGKSLRRLELRLDNLTEDQSSLENYTSKLDCIKSANHLESLKLWGVLMDHSPRWDVFGNLKNLEIVGAKVDESALMDVLQSCPYLTNLVLLGCEGVMNFSIQLRYLKKCKLDFYGGGNCLLSLSCPELISLEVHGTSSICVHETRCLRELSIANNTGRVINVDFGKLEALESLSIRGVQWRWDAISKMLQWATEVKHLFMKVEFTGDFDNLLPFPEVNFADFFNSHPKLRKFDIHGAMFAALCQKDSLRNADSEFSIPCLEEVVVTVRSPLNAEQKMSTLESLLRYARNLKRMVIKIIQMKSSHSSADDFFEEVYRFCVMNQKIVRIE